MDHKAQPLPFRGDDRPVTSGIEFSDAEKTFMTSERYRKYQTSHKTLAYYLTFFYKVHRTRKGVKDYFRRQRKAATAA